MIQNKVANPGGVFSDPTFLKVPDPTLEKTTRILIRPNFDLIKFFNVFQKQCNLFIIGIDQVRVVDPGEVYPGSDPGSDRKKSNPDPSIKKNTGPGSDPLNNVRIHKPDRDP